MTATEKLQRHLAGLSEAQREAVASQLLRTLEQRETAPEKEEASVVFEDMKHLLGVVEGPGDLSTNPAYMEGFGQARRR